MTIEINTRPTVHCLRCAIYTRTATTVEVAQSYSIQSQRSAAESFIADRADNGWTLLPDRYDDEGFSGSNIDRPGLQRLLDDVKNGKIDCVVTHSFDRLSRDVNDMSEIMLTLAKNEVLLATVVEPPIPNEQIRSLGKLCGGIR